MGLLGELRISHLVLGVIARSRSSAPILKPVSAPQDTITGLPLAEQHDVRIGHPVGRRDDHLVAGIEGGHQRVVDGLLAAAADGDLLGGVVEVVLPLELGADRLAQRRGAGDRGILGLAAIDGGLSRRLDVVGGVEVRLAGAEADDVAAGGLQLGGLLGDGDGR